MTAKITGGAAMIRAVAANGVDTIFGLPGVQIYALFEGIHETRLELVTPRHEQTAGYMAMGYAKSTGKTGVFAVVPGPGVLNAAAALCTAQGNCSPVVCLTGQIPSDYLGRGRGHLHELRDQLGTLRSIIKDAARIDDLATTSALVNRAFRLAQSGRPGAVSVEMCWDRMLEARDIAILPPDPRDPPPEPDVDTVQAAVEIIAAAKRPMIMCGAGAQHASAEVLALAELLDAPVTAFRSGRGVVAEDHALGVACVAARELWDDTDVLIGIGSRLEMPFVRWRNRMGYEPKPSHPAKLVRIDIDPAEMTRLIPDAGIVADSAAACRLLVDRLATKVRPRRERRAEIAAAKGLAQELIRKLGLHAAYLEAIRAVVPRTGFLVPELSQTGFTAYTGAYSVLAPRTFLTEGYEGTLGFGFPTALGVKVANPDTAVVSITGDGGFMFAVGELATAAQYDIGVVTLVFNNGSYGNVLRDQQEQFGGHVMGAVLKNPDFVRLAESFGVAATRVRSPAELRPALEKALAGGRPALIEIVIEPGTERSPWPLIHMHERPSIVARKWTD
jgi:acetolactate synthase-1/2/3 large subunit